MRKAIEDRFLKEYKKNTPQEIFEIEGRKAIATIASIRTDGRNENNRLKAAEILIEKAFPDNEIKIGGKFEIEFVSSEGKK